MKKPIEVNFDGLVGPTHNYAGLSYGNIASTSHANRPSNPKAAALQGLQKMKALHDLGIRQAVLPPQERPSISTLRQLGFTGSDFDVLKTAAKQAPRLLAMCSSASPMWTANAATVSPSSDSTDGRVHFTPANLVSKFHRSLEPRATQRILQAIFSDSKKFVVHDPLPAHELFGDEGAANHTRLGLERGIHIFVYGKSLLSSKIPTSKKFPARQSLEASQAVARQHLLKDEQVVFAQQDPKMIDKGVFHNDVVAVGNEDVFFYHEKAYSRESATLSEIKRKFRTATGIELRLLCVRESEVSTSDAAKSYLFNSQLITLPNGKMTLVAPTDCQAIKSVNKYLKKLVDSGRSPISKTLFFDLRQSMSNGGGPACLRLRVPLTVEEIEASHAGVFLTETLYARLRQWIEKHYRDRLTPNDLVDPALLTESRHALDELTQVLKVGSLYPFQTN